MELRIPNPGFNYFPLKQVKKQKQANNNNGNKTKEVQR